MARTAVTVAVAAVVLLAGCNAVFGDPRTQAPELTGTQTTVAYPPGVDDDDGVVDAVELVGAHGRATADRSYVSNGTLTVRYSNGTYVRRTRTVRNDADSGVYYVTQRARGPPSTLVPGSRVELWSNDTVAVGVVRTDDGRRFFRDRDNFARQATRARLLALFTKIETTTTGTTTAGDPLVHLLGVDVAEAELRPSGVRNTSEASFSASVTPDGVVRSYTLRYEGTFDGERVRVVEKFRLRPRADPAVDRPAWVPAAVSETNASQ